MVRRDRPGGFRDSRCLAYCLHGASDLYVMINAFWEPVRFQIQEGKARDWKRLVDTSQQEIVEEPVHSLDYQVAPRSVIVLEQRTMKVT